MGMLRPDLHRRGSDTEAELSMYACEWCGSESRRAPGNGHYYCSRECSDASRREKQKLRHRGYLYLLGADGKRHPVRVDKRPRPTTCELCGRGDTRLHYHHWDDTKPEQGIWVCSHCHRHAESYEKGLIAAYLKLRQLVVSGRD